LFCFDDCRSWPREEKLNNHGCFVSTHTFLTMIIEESVCFMSCEPIFFCNYSYVVHTEYIYIFFFINWTVRMSDNLPERVQILGHVHIICITVRENRIIWSQIVCDLLLKSAFEWIFNVMQLILVKIKWHIKWKYLIKKFHDICLSYYFKQNIVFRKYYLQFYKNCISISIRNIINLLYLDTYCIFLGEIDVEIEMCMFIVIVMVM
jgi:hypothetical protein